MKLADYLFQYRMTPTQFGRLLGVTSRSTVHRYVNGDRIPEPRMLQKINHITNGKVTLDDFLDDGIAECGIARMSGDGEPVTAYPWSRGCHEAGDCSSDNCLSEGGYSQQLCDALESLQGRASIEGDVFTLDGRHTDARRLVIEANKTRLLKGIQPIWYPGASPT